MFTGPEGDGDLEANINAVSALRVAYQRLQALNRQIAAEVGGALVPRPHRREMVPQPPYEQEERLPLRGMSRDIGAAAPIHEVEAVVDGWNRGMFEYGAIDHEEARRIKQLVYAAREDLAKGKRTLWNQVKALQMELVARHKAGDGSALDLLQLTINWANGHECVQHMHEPDALPSSPSQPALGVQQPLLTVERTPASPPLPESRHAKPVHIPRKRWSGGRKKFKYSSRLSS
ncbi:TPA: hypothetical protein DCL30_02195 [Candidatus Peribacteria bacterium]|nr:MAG: hypothetical protein A3J91_04110 [Candidatus Peribacteria bacterium RIFOXYC2_FULL_58_10]OGJ84566.1 MAG: hypothetical protein A2529_05940 [Candidatus Peribacteria bacterium RIFOXYD2_FULL_58_15]HAI98337.1 hypothetical protein [Candidatus Peribacteria bacterium]HAS33758.1 hypothetical protein [Candidatus Peribacteria bacterium]